LELIRDSFTSIDDEEFADHVYCVATPVFDSNSKPVAAVSVSGLKSRMVEKKEFLIEKVLETGKLITKEIGGEYPSIINNQTIGVENVI
jgi:DNA-binding IclR family transcriptional regulator